MEWIHLESVSSTNTWLTGLARERDPGQEAVLVAEFQSNGRGQGKNTWISGRGENLLMSVLLYPEFLSASAQFYLSVITSLAICDLIRKTVREPAIKWPNDILAGNRKIAGILIENSIMGGNLAHTVIGIGLNVNQTRFPEFPWKATSLALETGKQDQPIDLAKGIYTALMDQYELLKMGRKEELKKAYLEHLYLFNRPARYRTGGGEEIMGISRGISEYGELVVETEGKLKSYGMDAIRMAPK